MKMYKNFKIRTKLIIGFVILAIFTGAVGILGVVNTGSMYATSEGMYNKNFLPTKELKELQLDLERARSFHIYALYDRKPEKFKERQDGITKLNIMIDDLLKSYEKSITSVEERALYEAAVASIKEYETIREENMELIAKEDYVGAMAVVQKTVDARTKADVDLLALVDYNIALAAGDLANTQSQYRQANMLMNIIIVVAIALAVILGLVIAGTISKPVNKLVIVADKLALGDVNVNVENNNRDEVGMLSEAFGRMINNIRSQAQAAERIASGDLTVEVEIKSEKDLLGKKLSELVENNNEILSGIAIASDQVATGAKQISDSSMALSHGATEQASSVEELTASLEEISAQTDLNAKNASTANGLAEAAKNDAALGNKQMKEMLTAMEDINVASANISKVIKVIDDIAFQTNILALNAAVEAARAGQHGKGFAVVAEEVRNLAARSANAAKETTEMIEGSIHKAEGGTRIAKETATALSKIVAGVEQVASLVNNIAIASNEQAMGIAQINQGLIQVSNVVQTNSATSEETAASSEELSSQAELLKDTVSRYKLKKQLIRRAYQPEDISPEVMKMLENMSKPTKEKLPTPQITLNDNEFGKY